MPESKHNDVVYRRLYAQTTERVWPLVQVLHAQWRLRDPKLVIKETASILLAYALQHTEEAWEAFVQEGEGRG